MDLGADRRGVDMGPSALRYADLNERLQEQGHDVQDLGDIGVIIPETRHYGDPKAKYLNEIGDACAHLAKLVVQIHDEGRTPLQERRPAIVVMPLEDLSEGRTGQVFAGGLTDELASNLMRSGQFRLYSIYGRFLTEPTAEPAAWSERLDVGYVVKGSVRGRPDRVRLIVHLIDAQTGQYVWTDTYDRALTPENLLTVQEQLAADVARQLASHTALPSK